MNKITITKVIEAKEPYKGTAKQSGKPYTIYQYQVHGTVDGAECDYLVKTMDEGTANQLQAGGQFEGERSEYNGIVSYMVKKAFAPRSNGGGSKWTPKPTYSPKVWAAFARDMWAIAKALSDEDAPALFGFLLGAGAQHVDLGEYGASSGGKPSDKFTA